MAEIGRRLVHASGVVIPAVYLLGIVTWTQFQLLLLVGSVATVFLEIVRIYGGLQSWWFFQKLTREYEAESVAGYALYMFSITGVAVLFEPAIAIPAMLMLMLGDPVSGYVGSGGLQTVKPPRALASMFLVSFLVALPFTIGAIDSTAVAFLAAVVGAGCAMVADGIKPIIRGFVVDDNLTIPFAGALGIWLITLVAGI